MRVHVDALDASVIVTTDRSGFTPVNDLLASRRGVATPSSAPLEQLPPGVRLAWQRRKAVCRSSLRPESGRW